MRISIHSPVRKAAFLGAITIFSLLAWILSWQSLLQWHSNRSGDLDGFQRAARIQPLNAANHEAIGTIYLHLDHQRAAVELERAVELNPYSASAWLRLADAYSILARSEGQRRSVLSALKVAPHDTSTQWQAATLLLAEGDTDNGMRLMREVVRNDPARATAAMQVGFMLSDGNIPKTLDILPPAAGIRLQFMRWLMEHHRAEDADLVWPEIVNSGEEFPVKDAFFYVDSLIERQQVALAKTAWQELGRRSGELAVRVQSGNSINNGDFESDLLNTGFGWRYEPAEGVSGALDTTVFHGGTRALSIRLDSGNLRDSGMFQYVPVDPGTPYSLRAFVRGEEVESANGLRIIVTDAYSKQVLLASDECMGSFPWRESGGLFTTGQQTKLVRVGLGRSPAEGRIRGKIWIDDLVMEKR